MRVLEPVRKQQCFQEKLGGCLLGGACHHGG